MKICTLATETKDETEGEAVLEPLASEDEALLVGRDTLLVLGFDAVNSAGGIDSRATGEDLHEILISRRIG